ncbi:MAG: LysR family transcriptional regulator [Comamonadaceae bacterium]|nr:MAG: LysR family transcriptional regulator [Comamonadaceae bacterium]
MLPSRLRGALGQDSVDKRFEVLRAIAATGSISQAARTVSISYKAAWQALDILTNLAGEPLVLRAVGGSGGGGATLTDAGRELLRLADALSVARERLLASDLAGGAALGLRTSMRNQWRCRVLRIDRSGPAARVHLALGGRSDGPPLLARVTHESAELLALEEGQGVLALCKATAMRVMPATGSSPGHGGAINRIAGSVTRIARAPRAAEAAAAGRSLLDEVSLEIGGAIQAVGFSAAGEVTRVRSTVVASVAQNALVIALGG